MTSIGINNHASVNFHVFIDIEFEESNKRALYKVAMEYGNTISFYPISAESVKGFPFGVSNQPQHISVAAYYRLFVSKILPYDIGKIIYMDGDMIVRHSLEKLWETNIDSCAVGVVHDVSEPSHVVEERLLYPRQYGYFNSGMLLINVDYWRKNNCFERFSTFISNNQDKIIMHDQDVLNAVLYQEKKWLPITYNFQSGFIYKSKYVSYDQSLTEEINEYKNDPTIIHYVSSSKPWNINCFFSYRSSWRYYWRKSKWSGRRLENDNPQNMKEYVRNYLLRNDLWFPDERYQRIILKK